MVAEVFAMRPSAAKKAMLVFGIVAFSTLSAAQQRDRRPEPPSAETRTGPDAMIVRPPAAVDPELAKPAPPNKDPGLVEKPPADPAANTGGSRAAPPAQSRRDDCKGTAEDCKQNSAR